jgi:hypothetical protein
VKKDAPMDTVRRFGLRSYCIDNQNRIDAKKRRGDMQRHSGAS